VATTIWQVMLGPDVEMVVSEDFPLLTPTPTPNLLVERDE